MKDIWYGIPSGAYYVNKRYGGKGAYYGNDAKLPWAHATIPNCTGFAHGRMAELYGFSVAEQEAYMISGGNPQDWYTNAPNNDYVGKGKILKLPCIGSYKTQGSSTGHVNWCVGFDENGDLILEESDYYGYNGNRYYKQVHCNATSSYAIYNDGSRNIMSWDTQYRYADGVLTMPSRYTLQGYIYAKQLNYYDARTSTEKPRRGAWFYNQ